MRVCLTPQQRKFLFSVSIASAHGGSWQGPLHKSQSTSGKEAAVSLAMLTFRDGSCLQRFCSMEQGRMEQAVGSPLVRGCTGAWLSPLGLRKGNCQWSYSPGLALGGTLLGIGRGLGFQPLCSHFVTSRRTELGAASVGPQLSGDLPAGRKLVALCPACYGAECCARLIPTQTPQKCIQRCGGRKQRLFFCTHTFFCSAVLIQAKESPVPAVGFACVLYTETAEAVSKKHA